MSKKTLDNADIADARNNTADLEVHGNGDLWQLLCKASSEAEDWMKSTKVMEIRNEFTNVGGALTAVCGCLVQVTTQQGDYVAEALTYIPNVRISPDGKSLIA